MGDLYQAIIATIEFLWPFSIIEQWQRGGYYVFGRYWRSFGPQLLPTIPWFTKVIPVSIVPALISTPRSDISIKGGGTLSFSATAVVRVFDVDKALNEVDDYKETIQELVNSVLADRLAKVRPEALSPELRTKLARSLIAHVNRYSKEFGIEVSEIRFTSFVLNARTYRLLGEASSQLGTSW